MLRWPELAPVTRIVALTALGQLRSRQGDPAAMELLDEALERALYTGELQRICPVRNARAEWAWLAGDLDQVRQEAASVYDRVLLAGHRWCAGEFAFWLWRAGALENVANECVRALCVPDRGQMARGHRGLAESELPVRSGLGAGRQRLRARPALRACGVRAARRRSGRGNRHATPARARRRAASSGTAAHDAGQSLPVDEPGDGGAGTARAGASARRRSRMRSSSRRVPLVTTSPPSWPSSRFIPGTRPPGKPCSSASPPKLGSSTPQTRLTLP